MTPGLQSGEVGAGLRLAQLVSLHSLFANAYGQGLLTWAETRLPRHQRWEMLLARTDSAWFIAEAGAVAKISGQGFDDRAIRHAAALLGFHLRAHVGRARREAAAASRERAIARLNAHLRKLGVSSSTAASMVASARAASETRARLAGGRE